MPYLLPAVERAVYRLSGGVAAPRIKAGADVLPWWPAKGVFVLIERGEQSPSELVEVPGVAGIWWGGSLPADPKYTTAQPAGQQIAYLFLDDDPADAARRLRPALERRWKRHSIEPLLAAPFQVLVPYAWDRFVP